MGILVVILALLAVITVHEYGHYLACRFYRIPVAKFAVGVGKPLWKRTDKRGTEWSVRPFPIGGFVQPVEGALENRSPLTKAVVALAGPAINIVPFAVIALAFGKLGFFTGMLGDVYLSSIKGLFHTATLGYFREVAVASEVLSGPIGIAAQGGGLVGAIGSGWAFLLLFAVMSIGIGLVNLIPIPVLDGGRIVMAGVESVIGRIRTARIEPWFNGIGAVLLLWLFVVITFTDIGGLI